MLYHRNEILIEESKNKKTKRLNSIRGTQRFTKPSQTNGATNIPINIEEAIINLKNLAQKYVGVKNPYGFLTNLRVALGIPNKKGASKYGEVTIPKPDGSVLQASLRVTNHNADAETYITHNANYEYNLSIMVRKNFTKNTFKPHKDVKLDEYVYFGRRMEQVDNPLTQIVNSIIGFLKDGTYTDTTGVAIPHKSPENQDNKITENKTYKTMKRYVIKKRSDSNDSLLESKIRRVVRDVLKEGTYSGEEGEYVPDEWDVPGSYVDYQNLYYKHYNDKGPDYRSVEERLESLQETVKILHEKFEDIEQAKYVLSHLNHFENILGEEMLQSCFDMARKLDDFYKSLISQTEKAIKSAETKIRSNKDDNWEF